MTSRGVYQVFGLAYRAGKAAWGYQAVMDALDRGKACLLVIAADASPRLQNKMTTLCRQRKCEVIIFGCKEFIGAALGKPPCSVIGLLDENFARMVREKTKEAVSENTEVVKWPKHEFTNWRSSCD